MSQQLAQSPVSQPVNQCIYVTAFAQTNSEWEGKVL